MEFTLSRKDFSHVYKIYTNASSFEKYYDDIKKLTLDLFHIPIGKIKWDVTKDGKLFEVKR